MKIHLFFILIFCLINCETDKRQFYTIKTNSDTCIVVERKIESRTFMTIIVKGQLDEDCLITLFRNKNHNKNDNVTRREYVIKKGIIKDTLGIDDLYDNYAKIIYNHEKNKTGHLRFEVLF